MSDSNTHTPETAGSGQRGVCVECGLLPIINGTEVYDGCLGKLKGEVMNACCGHGDYRSAYIQYNDLSILSGIAAVDEQSILLTSAK